MSETRRGVEQTGDKTPLSQRYIGSKTSGTRMKEGDRDLPKLLEVQGEPVGSITFEGISVRAFHIGEEQFELRYKEPNGYELAAIAYADPDGRIRQSSGNMDRIKDWLLGHGTKVEEFLKSFDNKNNIN